MEPGVAFCCLNKAAAKQGAGKYRKGASNPCSQIRVQISRFSSHLARVVRRNSENYFSITFETTPFISFHGVNDLACEMRRDDGFLVRIRAAGFQEPDAINLDPHCASRHRPSSWIALRASNSEPRSRSPRSLSSVLNQTDTYWLSKERL